MQPSRRSIILGAGAAGVALVGAGAAWRVTRMPTTGVQPWVLDTPPPADVRLDAFRHAILAPNPHNRQPWLIELDGDDSALLRCDPTKRLPETDPFDRQITIGFGAFAEFARIAAAERGYMIEVVPFPAGEPQPRLDDRPIATLVFRRADVARDPLFVAIPARRTNRSLYAPQPPSPAQLAAIAREGVSTSADAALMARLRPLTVGAITTEITTPRTWMESVRLMRIGAAEIDAMPDGLVLEGPMIEGVSAIGMLSRATLADPDSRAFNTGLDQSRAQYASVPAIVWIATADNSRAAALEAGRRYARANLRATLLGLAMHPMSQALQEYAEVAPAFARVHALLGVTGGGRLQMLARIGTAPSVGPSPRWPMEKHLT